MTIQAFNMANVHASWKKCLAAALKKMDKDYLHSLQLNPNYLPGPDKIFNAFSIPVDKVNYVLFGESPYPRAISANGYAFWDAAVHELWSETGMSKRVNRATSLRHMMKMLLVAEGLIAPTDTTQTAISQVKKQHLVHYGDEFFHNLLHKGFLLLNATPVLANKPQQDAAAWFPFVAHVLEFLTQQRPQVTFVLFGVIARKIDQLIAHLPVKKLYAEHPYNQSFVSNQQVIDFFKPMRLLINRSLA